MLSMFYILFGLQMQFDPRKKTEYRDSLYALDSGVPHAVDIEELFSAFCPNPPADRQFKGPGILPSGPFREKGVSTSRRRKRMNPDRSLCRILRGSFWRTADEGRTYSEGNSGRITERTSI